MPKKCLLANTSTPLPLPGQKKSPGQLMAPAIQLLVKTHRIYVLLLLRCSFSVNWAIERGVGGGGCRPSFNENNTVILNTFQFIIFNDILCRGYKIMIHDSWKHCSPFMGNNQLANHSSQLLTTHVVSQERKQPFHISHQINIAIHGLQKCRIPPTWNVRTVSGQELSSFMFILTTLCKVLGFD